MVFVADGERADEARAGAGALPRPAARAEVVVARFSRRLSPVRRRRGEGRVRGAQGDRSIPTLVFTHTRPTCIRTTASSCELTWNTFRDHLILEYEIPKYDGDLGTPNLFVPIPRELAEEKARLVQEGFPTQSDKHWFEAEIFLGLMRLRGMESRSPSGYAEAFMSRKLSVAIR